MLATSEDTLLLVLETISVGIEIESGKWLTTELARDLTIALLEVWGKTNKGMHHFPPLYFFLPSAVSITNGGAVDPMFTSLLSDVLGSLAGSRNDGVYETVVKEALPRLRDAIAGANDEVSYIAQSALDLVNALAGGAPEQGLGDGFFAMVAQSLFNALKTMEDRDTLQVRHTLKPYWTGGVVLNYRNCLLHT
jgi:importin-9